jgi:hypothetical protein
MSAENVISNEAPPSDAGSSGAPGGKKIEKSFKRNLMIIGGIFLVLAFVVVGFIFMKSKKTDKEKANVNVAISTNTRSNPEGEQMSPAMRDAVKQKLAQEQKTAADQGQSVYMPGELLESPQPVKPAQVVQYYPSTQAPVYQPNQDDIDRLARRRAGLERQLGSLLRIEGSGASGSVPARISFSGAASSAAPAQAAQQAAMAPSGAASGPAQVGVPLAVALDIVAAETASPIDNYKTGFASARIVSGKLAGAYLIGSITAKEDGLQISFNQMRLGQKSYAIDAIALDEKTSTNAMSANVDRRYLERWVIPVITAGVGGFAGAVARPTQTTQVGANGSPTVIDTQEVSAAQARAAGISASMGILQKEVGTEAAKPFQLKLDANTSIGILFRQNVLDRP